MREADPNAQAECADPEHLALFIEGRLHGDERARLLRHMAACDLCRELVAEATAILPVNAEQEAVRPAARRFPFRPRSTAGLLALAASLVISVAGYFIWSVTERTPHRDLILAVGETRPADGRLVGFDYGPLAATRGGTSALSGDWRVLAAAAKVRSLASGDPSVRNLHALGVAHLVLGEYDDAVRILEEAAAKDSADAASQSDLSVAYLARAMRLESDVDFARSLAAAERAIEADPTLTEAYFNRAVALDALSMPDPARRAWEAYLERDPDGPWAAEARSRLAQRRGSAVPPFPAARPTLDLALDAGDAASIDTVVATYPQAARDYLSDVLLPRWADRVLAGADGAPELRRAERLASALTRRGRDRAAATLIEQIAAADTLPQRRHLALLHRTYAAGKQLQQEDRPGDAATVFAGCAGADGSLHPLELECRFQTTTAALNSGDRVASHLLLRDLVASAEGHEYFDLAGIVRWRLALFAAMDGDLTAALGEYQQALAAFEAAQATERAANVHSLMSEILRIIGDTDAAWRQHLAALQAAEAVWSPRVRHQILVQALLTSLDDGLPEVALHFADTLIDADLAWQHQPSLALAYAHRARALTQLGRPTEALEALADARRVVATVPDTDYQRRFNTELLTTEIEVLGAAQPDDVVKAADEGLANVLHAGSAPRVPGFLFARAAAQSSLGQADAAERDYTLALDALEDERARLSPNMLQISHMERNFGRVRAFVDFQLTVRGDPERALAVLEQSKARWLLAAVRGADARPVQPRAVMAVTPSDTAIVYYGVLGEGVHAWLLTNAGLTYRRLPPSAGDLAASVRELWNILQSTSAGERVLLTALHDQLIAPLRDAIGARRRLVLVPDGPIYNLPVAALVDRATGRYLVEDFAVTVGPSLTLAPVQRGQVYHALQARSVGIFGGNVADRAFLSEVAAEQQAIAAIYPATTTRRYHGDKHEFLGNVDRHDVVHFAGHAVANVIDPALSRLEFPAAGGLPTGDVLAAEITALRLEHVRVVVLAACRTGSGPNVAGEGTLSLAHAFLAAGAGAVVSSFWDVDDLATRMLLTSLHEEMARGVPLADALRTAQLRAIAGDPKLRRPSSWAAFVANVRS